jgi:hypothetical protein
LALSFQILISLVLVLFIGFSLLNSLAVMQLDSIMIMGLGLAMAWFEIGAVCTAGHKLHQKVSRFFRPLAGLLLPKQHWSIFIHFTPLSTSSSIWNRP